MARLFVAVISAALPFVTLSACGTEQLPGNAPQGNRNSTSASGTSAATGPDAEVGALPLAEARDIFCPAGTTFLSTHRLCVTATDALGPFPRGMIDACVAAGGGTEACSGARWNLAFAKSLRGTGACPPGSSLDDSVGECVSGVDAFGPFPKGTVSACQKAGGGSACESMRIARSFLPKATGYVGTRPYMKITRGQGNAYSGLRALRLELRDRNSRVVDVITTVSGQANAQAFRTARVSRSGSMEPLPEGLWRVRYPNAGTSGIEWAGRPYDYSASFGPGFGATFTEIVTQDGFPTARSGIAFHLDNNRASSPGTAGCVAFPNLNDMTRFVGWFREPASAPRTIVVDWGLGTLPGRFSLSDVASFGLTSDYLPVWKRLEESLEAGETLPADIAP